MQQPAEFNIIGKAELGDNVHLPCSDPECKSGKNAVVFRFSGYFNPQTGKGFLAHDFNWSDAIGNGVCADCLTRHVDFIRDQLNRHEKRCGFMEVKNVANIGDYNTITCEGVTFKVKVTNPELPVEGEDGTVFFKRLLESQ